MRHRDRNWPVGILNRAFFLGQVVAFRVFVVAAQVKLHVFDSDLLGRHPAKRHVQVIDRLTHFRVKELLPIPHPGSVIAQVVLVSWGKNLPEVKAAGLGRIQVVVLDELAEVSGIHVVGRVIKVDFPDDHHVWGYDIAVVWHPAGNPLVAGPGFHVPDFIFIAKSNPVAFAGPVFFHQAAQALNPFSGRLDERQDQIKHGVFPDPVFDKRIMA